MNVETTFQGGLRGERDPRPVVTLPRPILPGAAIAAGTALAAVLLFLMLDNDRRTAAAPSGSGEAAEGAVFLPAPALSIPPESLIAPQYVTLVPPQTRGPLPVIVERAPVLTVPSVSAPVAPNALYPAPLPQPSISVPELSAPPGNSFSEPALVMDSGAAVAVSSDDTRNHVDAQGAADGTAGARSQPARLTKLASRSAVIASGTLISAVLETPIDTSRPGLVRAIVSRDARGFDGRRVLIPRGSRLIGEYQSDVRPGQNRVLVNWTRLIRADGTTLRIDSPAADQLGGAGVPGRVNALERFFGGVLQTALAIGETVVGRRASNTVIIGMPGDPAAAVTGQTLFNTPRARVRVKQGSLVNVFVARDLEFPEQFSAR